MTVDSISDTIHRLVLADQEILLVGTAHVSQTSVEEVAAIIEQEQPDRICIELDEGRMKSKTQKTSWESMDIRKVIKEGRGFFLLANTALASFQRRMGAQTGIKPGEEILKASDIAKERSIPLSLCDRDIQTTFKRAWAKSSLWNKCKLMATLLSAAFSNEEISAEELEDLKKQDTLQAMMNEMAKELPTIKEVLIDERDQYLARSIFEAPGHRKVAVIGAGHTSGVISTIAALDEGRDTPSLESLEDIPKGRPVGKIVAYAIPLLIIAILAYGFLSTGWDQGLRMPLLIIAILAYGFLSTGWDQGLRMFLLWVAVNCSCTLVATLLSLAHPLNIIACSITAPFFALHPALGVGMLGGVLEATLRKPKVKDFEGINDDAMRLSGWYRNRILHALVVFLFSSLGSMFGTLIAFPLLISRM